MEDKLCIRLELSITNDCEINSNTNLGYSYIIPYRIVKYTIETREYLTLFILELLNSN